MVWKWHGYTYLLWPTSGLHIHPSQSTQIYPFVCAGSVITDLDETGAGTHSGLKVNAGQDPCHTDLILNSRALRYIRVYCFLWPKSMDVTSQHLENKHSDWAYVKASSYTVVKSWHNNYSRIWSNQRFDRGSASPARKTHWDIQRP